MTPGERVKQVRETLKKTQAEFGAPLGFTWYKIKDIESGKIKVSPDIATKIDKIYSYRFEWLLTGKGEKFSGSPPLEKETLEPESALPIYDKDIPSRSRERPAGGELPAPGIKISEDLTLAARVLESNTPYAIALHLNIQSFARALDAGERITVLESNQHAMQLELKDLRTELNRLKATYEAPNGGTGHLTDTEKQAM